MRPDLDPGRGGQRCGQRLGNSSARDFASCHLAPVGTLNRRDRCGCLLPAISRDRAHLTPSFAAGSVLNIKSGRTIDLEQRTLGRRIWSPDDLPVDPAWPHWTFRREELAPAGGGLVVAASLTHDVASAVRTYPGSALPSASGFLSGQVSGGPSARSVVCGRHAFDLVEALTAEIRAMRRAAPDSRVHLFMAALGAFSFLLGQRQTAIGLLTLYEFDFEGGTWRLVSAVASLPVR